MIKKSGYEINDNNLINHEMIGLKIKVIESTDPMKTNMTGKIIDETKNTFVLEDGKVLPKKECIFEFDINEKVVIDGKKIIKRPQDRIMVKKNGWKESSEKESYKNN